MVVAVRSQCLVRLLLDEGEEPQGFGAGHVTISIVLGVQIVADGILQFLADTLDLDLDTGMGAGRA